MVVVAQLVRALDCGSRGRRFETGLPPKKSPSRNRGVFFFKPTSLSSLNSHNMRLKHTTFYAVLGSFLILTCFFELILKIKRLFECPFPPAIVSSALRVSNF